MIEKMTRLALAFHHADSDFMIRELQRLGICHLEGFGLVKTPQIAALEERVEALTRCRDFLRSQPAPADPDPAAAAQTDDFDEVELIRTVDGLKQSLSETAAERERLRGEIEEATSWGRFDPARIRLLREAGYGVKLFFCAKSSLPGIEESCAVEDTCVLETFREERGLVWFIVVYPLSARPPQIDAVERQLPQRSMAGLRELEAQEVSRERETRKSLAELHRFLGSLEEFIRLRRNELARKLAEASLTAAGDGLLHIVKGWVPSKKMAEVGAFLEKRDVLFFTEEPGSEDKVPILLRNRPFAKLFEPIMRIFNLPSYGELDTTPFLAPFYAVFFGLCVADLAYGVILLLVLSAAFIVFRHDKRMRPLISLGMILSASVALMGVFLNEAGGIPVTALFGRSSVASGIILFPSMYGAMFLAISLGVIQVIFGRILRVVNQVKKRGPLGALGPAGVVLILVGVLLVALRALGPGFKVGPIPVGAIGADLARPRPVVFAVIGVGMVLLLFFDHLESKVYVRPGLGMWELYELATGTIGDVLSYLRLFALGLASGLLAQAIVRIALMVKGDAWWGYLPMAIVLLLGTGINVAIGVLSGFVHSLRLTFVEFYKAIGFSGGGIEYKPFKRI
jgi:V/A-type H+-transporting ATPase subunit I